MSPHVFANGFLIKICKTLCTLSAKCHSPRIDKRKITQALAPTPKPTHSFPHQHLSLSVFRSLDFTHSWGKLPVPGGYCPCLGDTARAWGILLHLLKGFTSSRSRVSMDPADRVPPTPATHWHHPASNHKGILEGVQSSIELLLTGFRSNQNIPLVHPPTATHQANPPPPPSPK